MIAEAVRIAKEALIKPFEGYHRRLPDGSCKAYPDPGTNAEPWTIGWGSTGPEIGPETIWVRDRAEQALDAHLAYFVSGALRLSPGLVNEPPRRLAAIISFCYNCGLGNYRISRLRARVNEGAWDEACEQLLRWNKAAGRVLPGLTRRRQAEATFLR